jgi:uncharacterized membrane protein
LLPVCSVLLAALSWSVVVYAQEENLALSLESGAILLIHPIAVHFAIALVLFGFITDWFGSLSGHAQARQIGRSCFLAGVGALGFAVLSGWIEQELPRPPSVFDAQMQGVLFRHEYLGYGLFAFFLILAIIRVRLHGRLPAFFVLLAALGSVGVIIQGYLGGELVYRYGAGVRAVQVLSAQLEESGQKKAPE